MSASEASESGGGGLRERLAEEARECGARSSVHGVPALASPQAPSLVKLLWLGCMLASWSYLLYVVVVLVRAYSARQVISSVGLGYEAPADFPAVDFCVLAAYNGTRAGVQAAVAAADVRLDESGSYVNYTDALGLAYKTSLENATSSQAYSLGMQLKSVLISCQYQGELCTAADFYPYHDFTYGNCFRFNGGPRDRNKSTADYRFVQKSAVLQATSAGWRKGLRLELYAGPQQYAYKTGFRLLVHNQSVAPLPDDGEGVDVPVGYETNIGVRRTFEHHLPSPYSDCLAAELSDGEPTNALLAEVRAMVQLGLLAGYQRNVCVKLCYLQYLTSNCQCIDYSLSSIGYNASSVRYCSSTADLRCVQTAGAEFYASEARLTECYAQCPTECDQVKYRKSLSFADYPTRWLASFFTEAGDHYGLYGIYGRQRRQPPTYELVRATTALVQVYYESLTYTEVTEQAAVSYDDLLNGLAGNLGLFTGSSVLSFVELAELGISLLFVVYQFKRRAAGTIAAASSTAN